MKNHKCTKLYDKYQSASGAKCRKSKEYPTTANSLGRPKEYSSWCPAKRKAWDQKDTNPNAFFYRFTAPGEEQHTGPWSDEEHKCFMKALQLHSPQRQGNWGLFSIHIPGRVGYQCRNYYYMLLCKGILKHQDVESARHQDVANEETKTSAKAKETQLQESNFSVNANLATDFFPNRNGSISQSSAKRRPCSPSPQETKKRHRLSSTTTMSPTTSLENKEEIQTLPTDALATTVKEPDMISSSNLLEETSSKYLFSPMTPESSCNHEKYAEEEIEKEEYLFRSVLTPNNSDDVVITETYFLDEENMVIEPSTTPQRTRKTIHHQILLPMKKRLLSGMKCQNIERQDSSIDSPDTCQNSLSQAWQSLIRKVQDLVYHPNPCKDLFIETRLDKNTSYNDSLLHEIPKTYMKRWINQRKQLLNSIKKERPEETNNFVDICSPLELSPSVNKRKGGIYKIRRIREYSFERFIVTNLGVKRKSDNARTKQRLVEFQQLLDALIQQQRFELESCLYSLQVY